jgi:hypothetical protein
MLYGGKFSRSDGSPPQWLGYTDTTRLRGFKNFKAKKKEELIKC